MAASIALLDELYTQPAAQPSHDPNCYSFGRIAHHNIILVCLPSGVTGTSSAATVATHLRSTFPSIRYGLLVGVGGGAPSAKSDIRLGDVVVSKPIGIFGGVVQYDFGKTIDKGVFKRTGFLNKPPRVLLKALASLETKCLLEGNQLTPASLAIPDIYPELRSLAKYPGTENDRLYKAECDHSRDPETCEVCDKPLYVDRPPRDHASPVIHFGLIASANQVMRHGMTREKLRKELDVLCFEMEAAGIMDNFPCLVVRGICDYADIHKTKEWQPYAAVTAAACAKQILLLTPGIEEDAVAADDPGMIRITLNQDLLLGTEPFNTPNRIFNSLALGCQRVRLPKYTERPFLGQEYRAGFARLLVHWWYRLGDRPKRAVTYGHPWPRWRRVT